MSDPRDHDLAALGERVSAARAAAQAISWDEALDALAARIRAALAEGRHNQIMVHLGRPGEDGFTERVLASWGVDGHNSHTNVCSSGGRTGFQFWMGIDRPSPDHAHAKVIYLISAHLEAGHYFNPHAQRITLYASLGEAAEQARRPATAQALTRSRQGLFAEHLWPWLPAYLDAVADLAVPSLTAWAELCRRAVTAEFGAQPAWPRLPLALRSAPGDAWAGLRLAGLAEALTTPVRSGVILTRRRLAAGAGEAGVGHRIGERRYTLRAMFGQDPHATLAWAAREAMRWRHRHASRAAGDQVARWWAARAGRTGTLLLERAASNARPPDR